MATKKYLEQFLRTKRFLQRFAQLNTGVQHMQPSSHYDDDVYSFFQNCYHLKDWIKNDPYCSAWNDVEAFINSNTDLQICADLCNSLKHLKLTKQPRSAANPKFGGSKLHLDIKDGAGKTEVKVAISYAVSTTSGDIDAFHLASQCVTAWEQFIAKNDP